MASKWQLKCINGNQTYIHLKEMRDMNSEKPSCPRTAHRLLRGFQSNPEKIPELFLPDDIHDKLCELINRHVLKILPEEGRIRLGSLEESEVSEEILRLFHEEKRLCPHLHLPLQSGSPSVLQRMGRKYGREEYLRSVRLLREARPGIALTTDLIVGFPEESEEEHRESMDFLKEIGFARVHVFPYSSRPGTRASLMEEVPPAVRKRRTREALRLSSLLEEAHFREMEGKEGTLLVERVEDGVALGHTEGYLSLALPSEVLRPGETKRLILRREWMVRSDDE